MYGSDEITQPAQDILGYNYYDDYNHILFILSHVRSYASHSSRALRCIAPWPRAPHRTPHMCCCSVWDGHSSGQIHQSHQRELSEASEASWPPSCHLTHTDAGTVCTL